MDRTCPFCRRLSGEEPFPATDVVWEFPRSVAVLGTWQYYRGYCLLVSREHATELSQLDEAHQREYLHEMCLLVRAIESVCRPRKMNYELLGNQVPHLHWHLFPRYAGDAEHLKPVWVALERAEHDPTQKIRLQGDAARRGETIAELQRALTDLGALRA